METSFFISSLRSIADPNGREAAKKNFPTSMEYLGVRTPYMREKIKIWWEELKTYSPHDLLSLSKELVNTRVFECNQLAYEFMWKNKSAMKLLCLSDLVELGSNMDNWATTDAFSVMLLGWAWRNGQISDADILDWLNSENLWWRRAAVVSTVGLNLSSRGGKGDAVKTLMVCEKVVTDREDMIVKALSWALRELSKHDKPAAEAFMKNHEIRIAGRVKREVFTKLITGKKNG